MMKKSLFNIILFLSLGWVSSYAQLSISPKDTLTCPTQPIQYRANFETDRPTNISTDDNFGGVVNIGFNFEFFGNTYTQCVISGNNFISFDLTRANAYSSYVYTTAQTSGDLNNVIMFPFQDLNPAGLPGNRISYVTVGNPGSRKFIVQFCNIPLFSCGTLFTTNQLILYEGSNHIEIHTTNKPAGCTTWQNGTGVMGIVSGANSQYVPGRNLPNVNWGIANEGLRFVPLTATTYRLDTITYSPFPIIIEPDYNNLTWYKEGSNVPLGTGQFFTATAEKNVNKYYAVYAGAGTCYDTVSYRFTDSAVVRFNNFTSNQTVEICAGQTYNFFDEDIYIAGRYTKLLTTTKGCDSNYILNLVVNPLPDATLNAQPVMKICDGNKAFLAAANPKSSYSYQWFKDGQPFAGGTAENIYATEGGEYWLEITSNKGCKTVSDKIQVIKYDNPTASINGIVGDMKKVYCNYDTITLEAAPNEQYEYIWSPDKNFRNFNMITSQNVIRGQFREPTTEVVLVVRDQNGCMDTTSTVIYTQPCCEIFVPNAFTPNNDGLNDMFMPNLKPLQTIMSFVVFDRYGKQVYEWKAGSKGWDGTYSSDGELAPTGTYMYYLVYSCDDGKAYTEKEAIQLLR